jgi:D-alanine-D-alanine ligase
VLLERYVRGRELAVSVLGRPDGGAEVLPIVEAVPRDRAFYDFSSRYDIGHTDFVCPAQLDEAHGEQLQELALAAYSLMGCKGFARIDMMLGEDEADGAEILEINPIPGLTDTSLFPQAAEAAGISFDELVARVLELAWVTARSGS